MELMSLLFLWMINPWSDKILTWSSDGETAPGEMEVYLYLYSSKYGIWQQHTSG